MTNCINLIILFVSGILGIITNKSVYGTSGTIVSFILFLLQLLENHKIQSIKWFSYVGFDFNISYKFATVEILLCIFIHIILICLYSAKTAISYEPATTRKLGILNIFLCFMCNAILTNNIILFFVSIEALGLLSSILVSVEKNSEKEAKTVFSINKFASIIFLIGCTILIFETKSFEISAINARQISKFTVIVLLISCFCKGAQIPFASWLIDASKANICASILMHAGTIVSVGIIFISKFSSIFEQYFVIKQLMIYVGLLTTTYMSCMALRFNNIKKIIACLTISSAGIMFITCGLGSYSLAMLCFICHTFFKSLLFLAFAYLISAMSGEKNINVIGGIAKASPKVADCIWISSIFASGFPFLASFFPKIALSWTLDNSGHIVTSIILALSSIMNIIAIIRMISGTLYDKPNMNELTYEMATKSNKYNFYPFWILCIATMCIPFYMWLLYQNGGLCLESKEIIFQMDSFAYIKYSVSVILTIAISIRLFDKFKDLEKIELIMLSSEKSNHENVITKTYEKCLKVIDNFCTMVAYKLNNEPFRLIYYFGTFLNKQHIVCFDKHVNWILSGIAMCIIVAFLKMVIN